MTYNQQNVSLERTVAVIGSTSVGKSALSQVFVQNVFPEEYFPTIEKIYKLDTFQSRNCLYKLTLYDTAGLEAHISSIPSKYIDSNGFILVYSVADKQSFEVIKEIYEKLKDEIGSRNIHIVLIGNKTDLNEQRCVSYEEGSNLANQWQNSGTIVSFIETSAKTGERVQDVFLTLLDLIDYQKTDDSDNNNGKNAKKNSCAIS